MRTTSELKTVRVFDRRAVELINERAAREHRSAANAAAITIIEMLDKRTNKQPSNYPEFLSRRVVKDTGGEAASQGKKDGL